MEYGAASLIENGGAQEHVELFS